MTNEIFRISDGGVGGLTHIWFG